MAEGMLTAGGDIEQSVWIAGHGAGQLDDDVAATPERQLNGFVRSIALIERLGNALGTLAFTWATVVLLGGYPTVLSGDDDFWFVTAIVFLEAARMFNRNNRLDYQLLFGARGSFRPLGWNVLVVIVCFCDLTCMISYYSPSIIAHLSILGLLLLTGHFLWPVALRRQACMPLRRAVSLWSPVLAITLLGPCIPYTIMVRKHFVAGWIAYVVLLVMVVLVTISRMRFVVIVKLVDHALGSKQKQEFWHRVTLNLCMAGAIMIFALGFGMYINKVMLLTQASILATVSFGNLQMPAAFVRVFLALLRLIPRDYEGTAKDSDNVKNLEPSMDIFYGMVLGQGLLYTMACILEIFSFFPRRSLIRRTGFRGHWGVEAINLYYTYAFGKCMEGGVLAPCKISILTFAMECLNSESYKNQLYGLRMLQSLLQRDPTRTRLISKITISTNTMARLTRMLDCTSPRDTTIRLFAGKVIYEVAKSFNLRVVTIPGLFEAVYGLLGSHHHGNNRNPLLVDTDAVPNSVDNLIEAQYHLTQQADRIAEYKYWMPSFWQRVAERWSVPKEEPLTTDQDLLPALGMSILESLISCDQLNNCEEILRVKYIIPRIIGFTSYKSETLCVEVQHVVLLQSSLKVLHRLTSIDGEIGLMLRNIVSKHPFLLTNLANTLGNPRSNKQTRMLVAGILRNLAIDRTVKQEIGSIQGIITILMHMFLSQDGSSSTNECSLRKVVGQALSLLAMESANNCMAMIRDTRYVFIKELKTMFSDNWCRCVAGSLLQNMCLHARNKLTSSDLEDLSSTLPQVLERIMNVEGAELEILIGLSSQICRVIPEDFFRKLEEGDIKARFVKRLVDVLNASKEPSAQCPGIRRVIIEQVLNMVTHHSLCVNCFNDHCMIEALLVVEATTSKAENFRILSGDLGLMEYAEPLSLLVAKAKQLLSAQHPSPI